MVQDAEIDVASTGGHVLEHKESFFPLLSGSNKNSFSSFYELRNAKLQSKIEMLVALFTHKSIKYLALVVSIERARVETSDSQLLVRKDCTGHWLNKRLREKYLNFSSLMISES